MLGKGYLCAVVTQDAHGQAAPVNPSTDGSRQESWATPRAGKTTDENLENWQKRKDKGDVATMPLTAQVKAWATPNTMDYMEPRPVEAMKRMLEGQRKNRKWSSNVREQVVWDQNYAPAWATPKASDPQHAGPNNKGGIPLGDQARRAEQWGTPRCSMAQDKQEDSGKHRLGEQIQHGTAGKLNPRWVETLMGLPIGWTMPSCMSPLIIAPTNCDFLETESFLPPQNELF
jgi:hypothetical protein